MKLIYLLSCVFFFSVFTYAQKKNEAYQLHIRQAKNPIIIDGIADESDWLEADIAENFFMILPMDTSFATIKTEVKMTYDQHNIYVLAICHSSGTQMVESLRRDFSFVKNDNFIFFLDPFDDQTNGFTFGANAVGAQWDGAMYEGGKVDLSWDNKWTSVVKNYPDKYVFEAAIP
ncbi:MAG: carbohydrate binding family 9 domain-containing protein, partial [Ginsengibacter sp.]